MLLKLIEYLHKNNNIKFMHKGLILDNDDPSKIGRIKATVAGLYEDQDLEKLPWIYPINAAGLGGRTDSSSFIVPEIGSEICIIFPYDDIYFPCYIGYYQSKKTHQRVFDENYPLAYGFMDAIGNSIKVDKSDGSVVINHTSGSIIKIEKDGSMSVLPTKSLNVKIKDESSILEVAQGQEKLVTESLTITNKKMEVTSEEMIEIGGSKVSTVSSIEQNILNGLKINVGGSSSEGVVSNKASVIGGKRESTIADSDNETIGNGKKTTIVVGDYEVTTQIGAVKLKSTIAGVVGSEITLNSDGSMEIISNETGTPMSKIVLNSDGSCEINNLNPLAVSGASLKITGTGQIGLQGTSGAAAPEEIVSLLEEVITLLSTTTAPGFGAPISSVPDFILLKARIAGLAA